MTYYFKTLLLDININVQPSSTRLAQLERIKILIKKRDRYLNGITIFLKIIV